MKVTLITGASGGIGEAFARRLASEKHNLVLVARSEDKLAKLCEELKAKYEISAEFIAVDLTEHESDLRLFNETEKFGLEVEWLINNAGFGAMGDFTELDFKNQTAMITLNVSALVALTHRYLKPMRERKSGTIINVASTASFQPIPYFAVYAATKSFVRSFTEAIAEENRAFNINILTLNPGPTETGFFEAGKIDDEVKSSMMQKGMQTPEEVVEAALEAVKAGKDSTISGWINWLVASSTNFVPNFLITRAMGGVMRSKLKKQ